jgi:hypothetical protein
MRRIFPQLHADNKKAFKKRLGAVTSYIRKTVQNYEESASLIVSEEHVFWRAKKNTNLGKRSEWRQQVKIQNYINWARTFWKAIVVRCDRAMSGSSRPGDISHDSYLKIAQLGGGEEFQDDDFQVVIVDEAQDFTPCQADLFWGKYRRRDRAVYLFGDQYQQLYRFRGAGDSFQEVYENRQSQQNFDSTGSFRFGSTIADTASTVLKSIGGKQLKGRAVEPGELHDAVAFDNHGVVLCRTNKGLYSFLFDTRPTKWCYLDNRKTAFPEPKRWVYDLEAFLRTMRTGNEGDEDDRVQDDDSALLSIFRYNHETFNTVEEIDEYIADEGDTELLRNLSLLQFLINS